MKKIFKIMVALVLMLTFTFTITACNGEGKDADPTTLTVADVFQDIEMSTLYDKKEITYSQMNSATTINGDDVILKYKCIASYDFEVSKIIIKFKSSYTDYRVGDKINFQIFDNAEMKPDAPDVAEKALILESSADFNKEHTIEFTFTSDEFVVAKNKILGVYCWDHMGVSTISVNIQGRVIK